MRTSLPVVVLALFVTVLLGGCSTMRSIDRASADFSKLAESATKLADASAETIDRAKETMAVMDEHMGAVGKDLSTMVPKLAEDSRLLVQTFEKTTRDMGAATTATLEQTTATMKQLTPSIEKTLDSVSGMTVKYGTAIEKIGEELAQTGDTLDALAKNLDENATLGGEWIIETRNQLAASMKAAERTLDQTAGTLANLEKGLLETLNGTTKTLHGINKVLHLEAEDDADDDELRGFGHRLDTLVTTFLWVFLAGGVLLVVLTTLVVYERLTARRRLRLQLAALGVDVSALE